jgi:hypothetical protein
MTRKIEIHTEDEADFRERKRTQQEQFREKVANGADATNAVIFHPSLAGQVKVTVTLRKSAVVRYK